MRLTEGEVTRLIQSLSDNLKEIPFQLYAFGSRVDDKKRGGDIDLLLLISPEDFEKVYTMKSLLKYDLEQAAGDQRVDLTLATEDKLKEDIFLAAIADEIVRLRA